MEVYWYIFPDLKGKGLCIWALPVSVCVMYNEYCVFKSGLFYCSSDSDMKNSFGGKLIFAALIISSLPNNCWIKLEDYIVPWMKLLLIRFCYLYNNKTKEHTRGDRRSTVCGKVGMMADCGKVHRGAKRWKLWWTGRSWALSALEHWAGNDGLCVHSYARQSVRFLIITPALQFAIN